MKLLICAGEASGDQLAASVVYRLPDVELRGLAGPAMREAGVGVVRRAEDATGLGIVEVVRSLPRIRQVYDDLVAELDRWQPDAVLTVDSPSLLLRVGRRARKRGIPVVHLVSPQLWAWRPWRVRRVAASADVLLCLLPFEPQLYAGTSVEAVFVGHPAAARVAPPVPVQGSPVYALMPGSRPQEVRRHWPILREVARQLRRQQPDCAFVVPVAPTIDPRTLQGLDATYVSSVMAAAATADAALVTSGTATLEVAAAGTPMVVIYAVHPLTWTVGRVLVRGTKHLALPNVVAQREGWARAPVREHLQHLDPTAIARDLRDAVDDDVQRAALAEVVSVLRGEGAVTRIAARVQATVAG